MTLRLTFRDKCPTVCWQKQLRDKFNAEGVPPVPHLDVGKAIVRPISRDMAKQIIFRYEWLGTMSTTSLHFGLFFGSFCAGVTCVSFGAAMAGTSHHMQFGIEKGELLTLARGACVHWAPAGSNSRLVAWTCRLLAKEKMGKLIWATSDTDAGEIGTIYQACGWVYVGKTSRGKEAEIVSPIGKAFNNRMISSWADDRNVTYSQMRKRLLLGGWTFQSSNPKGRYVYILDRTDKRLIDKVEAMRQPYPKRGTGETDNAAHSHAQTGGASPTVPLLNHGS